MNFRGAIEAAGAMGGIVVQRYLEDLSDADLMIRPGPGCNHIAWQVGHVIASNSFLLDSICPGKGQMLPAGFREQHSKEVNGSDDAARFLTKKEYLDLVGGMQAALKAALADVSESQLDEPGPEQFRSLFPTVGHMFMLIANHLMMHAGQFAVVRRQLGKPVVI